MPKPASLSNLQSEQRRTLFHLKPTSLVWWVWFAIATSMIAHLSGIQAGQGIATLIAACHATIWLFRFRSVAHFPTQVRVVFVLWMVLGLYAQISPLFWSLTVGTCLFVLFGYCPVARMLLLLPINRSSPLSLHRVIQIVFHPPTNGSMKDAFNS